MGIRSEFSVRVFPLAYCRTNDRPQGSGGPTERVVMNGVVELLITFYNKIKNKNEVRLQNLNVHAVEKD